MYADEWIGPWYECLGAELPGLALFDAHTHTGSNDPDGFSCTGPALEEALALAGARGAVFSLHEPEGYGAANDRILAEAAASDGRLVPFCRLDPRADAVVEARRCLAAGARGIKLHPRSERFRLSDPGVPEIFALADERGLPVVVHAGRGIPALGRDALALCREFPDARVILAHAAVSDLSWLWRHVPEHPNLFFDTSWWSADDLLALFALVPPGQILFGSDTPYGTPREAAVLTLRCALQAGLTAEQIDSVASRQLERLLAGALPMAAGDPPGTARLTSDILLGRLHSFLLTAIGRMLIGDPAEEYLASARLACEVGEGAPQAECCRSIVALLERHDRYLAGEPSEAGSVHFPGLEFVIIAACVARTPDVPVPPTPHSIGVGERSF